MNDTASSAPVAAESAHEAAAPARPRFLLLPMRSSCASERIYKWTLPAYEGVLPDGRHYNACPTAGVCADLCYARAGHFQRGTVLAAHQRNLMYVMDDLPGWEAQMTEELQHRRYRAPAGGTVHVRVHDAGDYWSVPYLQAWLRIFRSAPHVTFYSYTKQVAIMERWVRPDPPANFHWRYSYGGRQDDLIDPLRHPHADVFPDEEAVEAAGYTSQTPSDLLAVYGPQTLGVTANNIPHLKKAQGSRSFRALQRAAKASKRDPQRRNNPAPRRPPAD
ncbi:GP88 family protein [Streptomyces goshikiensis]